ncbi:MAG: TIGR01841 family phasin [Pseudomonadota bacterium]
MTDKFPFAFDMEKMQDMLKVPFDGMFDKPFTAFDFTAMQDAQKKNMAALIEANKVAATGYQTLYKRMSELFEASMAETKERMQDLQGQPMTADAAQKNAETMKAAFEKALADVKELTEMAATANTDAFEIIKARTEEVMAEIKAATDKLAA